MPPHVRLIGVTELSAQHTRDALILLATVKDMRARMGVPIYQLTRTFPDLTIRAQSFGAVDTITVQATGSSESGSTTSSVKSSFSGPVFYHEAVRGSTVYRQGIVSRNDFNADPKALKDFQVVNNAWGGYASENAVRMGVGAPALDERKTFPVHASVYNAKFDVTVVVQQFVPFYSSPPPVSRIFIGGVEMLTDYDGCTFVGARLYDDGTLGLAYIDPSFDKLCVEFMNVSTLVYQTPFRFSPTSSIPRISVPNDGQQTIFHFHPTRHEGTFISQYSHRYIDTPSGVNDYLVDYAFGYYKPNADPTAGFVIESSATDVRVRSIRTFNRNQTASITLAQTHSVSYTWSIRLISEWYTSFPPPYEAYGYWTIAAGPEGRRGESGTLSGSYNIPAVGSASASVSNHPVWTGYDRDGNRLVWKVTGAARHDVTGAHTGFVSASQSLDHKWASALVGEFVVTDLEVADTALSYSADAEIPHRSGSSDLTLTVSIQPTLADAWTFQSLRPILHSAFADNFKGSETTLDRARIEQYAAIHGGRWVGVTQRGSASAGYDGGLLIYSITTNDLLNGAPTVVTYPPIAEFFRPNWRLDGVPIGSVGYGALILTVGNSASTIYENAAPLIYGRSIGPHQKIFTSGGAVVQEIGDAGESSTPTTFGIDSITYRPYFAAETLVPLYKFGTEAGAAYMVDGFAVHVATSEHAYTGGDGTHSGSYSSSMTRVYVVYTQFATDADLFSCTRVSNHNRRGCLYDEAIDRHVVAPYGVFVAYDMGTTAGTPDRHVYLADTGVTDISVQISTAKNPPAGAFVTPVITNNVATSDFVDPRGIL